MWGETGAKGILNEVLRDRQRATSDRLCVRCKETVLRKSRLTASLKRP